ncbi:cytochrome c-type protein NapC [Bordetella genomosp. 7]|uniref:NapC/NirT family cytochrome c n=1 Tax=Bordetella genomosp. 7 TaxID=1416805 RepID=UPI000B9EAA2D|nr:NapC/NirT family cytochrome c [Bordetella genomosp. 7]OZI17495.1 cytochrome c-type protein NapC [Bordetella genomosp. 7]
MNPTRWIRALSRRAWALLASGLSIAFILGIVFWGGFNTVMEWTNTEAFCISCHEMNQNVYQEYRNTVHYSNRTGVRAVCSDCHVPKEWGPKMLRKLYASNELLHHFLGTIDTPEKFEAKRATLAQNEWRRMKANHSRECRNCHDFSFFDYTGQAARSARQHQQGLDSGQTCIDCHKGIAHSLPAVDQRIGQARPQAVPDGVLHAD